MRFIRLVFILSLFLYETPAHAFNEQSIVVNPGDIQSIRLITSLHPVMRAQEVAVVMLPSLPTECVNGLFTGGIPTDYTYPAQAYGATMPQKMSFEILHDAFLNPRKLRLVYDIDRTSPCLEPGYCAITQIEMIP